MKQVRIHGRGGQGVVTAAELIAIAGFNNGWETQAFPSFGVERTGAPIEAFARLDKNPIRTREQVHAPDVLIVQDATLIGAVDLTRGCSKDTLVIINTTKTKDELDIDLPKEDIFVIDATKIALEILGRNIVNTVILGAFAKATGYFSLEDLQSAIRQKFAGKNEKIINNNIDAVTKAYNLL